jgi:hypothetical protein
VIGLIINDDDDVLCFVSTVIAVFTCYFVR